MSNRLAHCAAALALLAAGCPQLQSDFVIVTDGGASVLDGSRPLGSAPEASGTAAAPDTETSDGTTSDRWSQETGQVTSEAGVPEAAPLEAGALDASTETGAQDGTTDASTCACGDGEVCNTGFCVYPSTPCPTGASCAVGQGDSGADRFSVEDVGNPAGPNYGLVFDVQTGLTWMRYGDMSGMTQAMASSFCAGMTPRMRLPTESEALGTTTLPRGQTIGKRGRPHRLGQERRGP
jgi:hypothetical protein